MSKTLNNAIILVGHGYSDYYRKEGSKKAIVTMSYDATHASAYDYNEATGAFTGGLTTGAYTANTAVYLPIQTSSEIFYAAFESVNIVFNKETVKANDLQMFLQAANSTGSIRVSWASDSNYVFQSAAAERKLHEAVEETASFANSTIYYKGQKQIFVKEIKPLSRVGHSIKFKVQAILAPDTLDEIKIHHIEVLPSGMIFVGDNNA